MPPSQPAAEAAELIDGPRWQKAGMRWYVARIRTAGSTILRLDVSCTPDGSFWCGVVETGVGVLIEQRRFHDGNDDARQRSAKAWAIGRAIEVLNEAHRALQMLGGLVR